jgi:CubicO group peptidase (beta-lactamase class C family)
MYRFFRTVTYIALTLVTFSGIARAAGPDPIDVGKIESHVLGIMQDWEVPGLALAVVKGGEVVLARGFGTKEAGGDSPVDADTIFSIGAVTGTLTATAIGLLVQEEKILWDERVTDLLPGFQMYDPYVTREVTLRDLLSNRSGLGIESELLCYRTDLSRDEIVRRLRYLKPGSGFRSEFAFRNAAFVAAGQIIPAVTGKSWDDFIRERIFEPLDMKRTCTATKSLDGLDNVAVPHVNVDDRVTPVPHIDMDNTAPASSIYSSATDMAGWVRLLLNGGAYNDVRIVDEKIIVETWKPHIPIPYNIGGGISPTTHFVSYCLGWVAMDYQGRRVIWHSGSTNGMLSYVGLVPEEELGIVLLANYSGQKILEPLFYHLVDTLLGVPPREWNALYRERAQAKAEEQKQTEKAVVKARIQGTRPSLPLSAYAGTYENEAYGRVKVNKEGSSLILHFSSELFGKLEHWNFDTFRISYRVWNPDLGGNGKLFVSFALDPAGRVKEMDYGGFFTFTRLPDSTDEDED